MPVITKPKGPANYLCLVISLILVFAVVLVSLSLWVNIHNNHIDPSTDKIAAYAIICFGALLGAYGWFKAYKEGFK